MAELASEDRIVPPAVVLRIAEKLEKAGHETWFVGGGVRDALLGHNQLDWDLATAARPEEVQRLFRRTVPHGIRFGTVGVLDAEGRMHEVTTFRRDVETDGRHAVVEYGASLDEDLARRDFTINAIAFHPARGVRDPFGGRADLENEVVRAVGDPQERMREDRLRALRALRFASRLNFNIDPKTWQAIVDSAPNLPQLSPERIRQEIEKTMEQVARPSGAFARWRESGAFASLIPDMTPPSDATLAVIDCIAQPEGRNADLRRLLRIAALFLERNGDETELVLRRLRFPNDQIAWISALVDHVASVGADLRDMLLVFGTAGDADIRRAAAKVGRTRFASVLRLSAAVWSATHERKGRAPSAKGARDLYRRAIRIAYRDPVQIADLAVDGHDLQTLGVPPGPGIRHLQVALLDRVLEDPSLNTRDTLMRIAGELKNGSS